MSGHGEKGQVQFARPTCGWCPPEGCCAQIGPVPFFARSAVRRNPGIGARRRARRDHCRAGPATGTAGPRRSAGAAALRPVRPGNGQPPRLGGLAAVRNPRAAGRPPERKGETRRGPDVDRGPSRAGRRLGAGAGYPSDHHMLLGYLVATVLFAVAGVIGTWVHVPRSLAPTAIGAFVVDDVPAQRRPAAIRSRRWGRSDWSPPRSVAVGWTRNPLAPAASRPFRSAASTTWPPV